MDWGNRLLSRRHWFGLIGTVCVIAAARPSRLRAALEQSATPGTTSLVTPYDSLWRVVGSSLNGGRSDEAEGLIAIRDGYLTLVATSPEATGPTLALAGVLASAGTAWRLASSVGGLRTAGSSRFAEWTIDRLDISRADDALTLTLNRHVVRAVRHGLGIGQRARLDSGMLTLADDRFVLVARGREGLRSGFGTFFRRDAVYTLSPERWLADGSRGVSGSVPTSFDVDASATRIRFPDGGDVGVVEPLNRRPPRAPRQSQPRPQRRGTNQPRQR